MPPSSSRALFNEYISENQSAYGAGTSSYPKKQSTYVPGPGLRPILKRKKRKKEKKEKKRLIDLLVSLMRIKT
jgi:hypothetical protein